MDLFDEPQPIWVVNKYIWEELKVMSPKLADMWPTITPFFPTNDSTSGIAQWEGKPYFIYNQALRVENSFYQIKKATFVYSMRTDSDQTIPLSMALQKILDREDDTAKDINDFNLSLGEDSCPVYFHSFDVYQNEPGKPRESASAPFVVSNFMVVVKYHWLNADLPPFE